jgi:hypothetical protein
MAAYSNSLVYLSSALSICGTMLVFMDYFRDPNLWRRPARKLLVWLCIADFLTAVVYIFPTQINSSNDLCVAQAFLGIYFPVASFVWTDCIALYVYLIVSSLKRRSSLLRSSSSLFIGFHIVSWTIPLICAVSVYATGHAGRSADTQTRDW